MAEEGQGAGEDGSLCRGVGETVEQGESGLANNASDRIFSALLTSGGESRTEQAAIVGNVSSESTRANTSIHYSFRLL
jgi:hypothetical protein